ISGDIENTTEKDISHGVRIGGDGKVNKAKENWMPVEAVRFVLTLRKLPEEVIEEIHFLTVVAKFRREIASGEADTGILLKRLYSKKMEDPRWKKGIKRRVIILKEFVTPNILKKQEEQMSLSLYYHATEVELEVVLSKEQVLDESDQCIENLFDFEGLAAVDNEISKSILKKHKFGELWGLGRKVMVDAIEDDNEENYCELLRVFLSIQKKSQQNQKIIPNLKESKVS
ncbi:3355_t:CDS:10, partial [Funneliformis mosseae]